MTLDRFRPAVKGAVAPSVTLAKRVGLTPNGVSVTDGATAPLTAGRNLSRVILWS